MRLEGGGGSGAGFQLFCVKPTRGNAARQSRPHPLTLTLSPSPSPSHPLTLALSPSPSRPRPLTLTHGTADDAESDGGLELLLSAGGGGGGGVEGTLAELERSALYLNDMERQVLSALSGCMFGIRQRCVCVFV